MPLVISLSGFDRCVAGKRPPRGYVRAWYRMSADVIVYAPIGLHLLLRLGRAALLAWIFFCHVASDA